MRCVLAQTVVLVSLCAIGVSSQSALQKLSPEDALKRAAANEDKLRAVEQEYSYRQEILVQTKGEAGSITGQMHRISDVMFDDLGNRTEKIVAFPPSRLNKALGVMKPDFRSLLGVDPFFLNTAALSRYSVKFIERKKVDEIETYIFDVEPLEKQKRKDDAHHPFKGRVWIADGDFQIVKFEGRALTPKDGREHFPKFECYREFVEDKWWLPSFVYGEDVLEFKNYDLPIRVKITYAGYKRPTVRR